MKIPLGHPDIGKDEIEAVAETMKSGWVTQGNKVEQFEDAFANYCGTKYGIAVNTGTAALHIALAALDTKTGDEIITTPLSCVATTNPILYQGAKPIFVDVEPETLNINPELVEKKISQKTKAILPVHLFGHPADLDPLLEIAQKHNIPVIEDAAQAHGAKYKGTRVGSFGHISCFSFYADKLITTVEGGMALTNDPETAHKMRLLRSFGMTKENKFYHPVLGYNYKMPDISAAIGLIQLRKLDSYIEKKRRNIAYLKDQISYLDLKLPGEVDYAFNVYYVSHVLAGREKDKEKIVAYLTRKEIETRPLLSFIPEQPPYRKYEYNLKELRIAGNAHERGFYFSNSPSLTQEQLYYLASTLKKSVEETQE